MTNASDRARSYTTTRFIFSLPPSLPPSERLSDILSLRGWRGGCSGGEKMAQTAATLQSASATNRQVHGIFAEVWGVLSLHELRSSPYQRSQRTAMDDKFYRPSLSLSLSSQLQVPTRTLVTRPGGKGGEGEAEGCSCSECSPSRPSPPPSATASPSLPLLFWLWRKRMNCPL